jgi:hypothetical protein
VESNPMAAMRQTEISGLAAIAVAAPHDGTGEGDTFTGGNCKLLDVERYQ